MALSHFWESEKVGFRVRRSVGCAVAALCVGSWAPAAFAADDCGAPMAGVVTCAASATNYPNGISYAATSDINVIAPTGVIVITAAPATNGITITSTGSSALSGGANVTTTGDGSAGVVVTSGTGSASITVGDVSTSGARSIIGSPYNGDAVTAIATNGAANITVHNASAGGNAARAIVAVASGPATVTLSGTVNSATADGVDITGGTTATLTTAAGSSVSSPIYGAKILSLTGTTVNNAGTISGVDFALAITGGPATINNSGTINGAIYANGGGDVTNNSGTFNAARTSTFAAGDTFNNSGIVAIAAPGGIPSSVLFAGLAAFNNSGTIEMRNGVVGDMLTIAGNYVGSGSGTLGIDVIAGPVVSTDRLIVAGSVSGSTQVALTLVPGAQPLFSNGTTIVQAGAASSPNAFAVSPGTQNFGLVRYDVVYNAASNAYNLVSGPSDTAYNMLNYETAERNLWYKSADAVTAQLRAERDHLWNLGAKEPSGRFWTTMAASYDNTRSSRNYGTLGQIHAADTAYRQDYFGGQLGFDLSGGLFSRGGFAVGVTGGYINSKARLGNTLDKINFDAVNGGAYVSFTSGNIFANALGKYDYYWARPESQSAGFNLHLHGHSYGGRGEIGIRFGGDSFFVEPVAQISYVRASLDPFNVQGTSVEFEDRNGLRSKAGGRIGGNTSITPGTKLAFYAGVNYAHDFRGRSEVTFANLGGTYTAFGQKTRDAGEALAGINLASDHGISGFMEAAYTHSFGSSNNGQLTEEGAGGRAGIRVKF